MASPRVKNVKKNSPKKSVCFLIMKYTYIFEITSNKSETLETMSSYFVFRAYFNSLPIKESSRPIQVDALQNPIFSYAKYFFLIVNKDCLQKAIRIAVTYGISYL